MLRNIYPILDTKNMAVGIELVIFFVIVFLFWYKKKVWIYPANFPPGPRAPLPLVGDAYRLTADIPVGLKYFHKKHGNIIGLNAGGLLTVSISDYETIQKTMAMDEYSHRIKMSGFEIFRRDDPIYEENTSLVFGHGAQWNVMHRFSLR